MGTELVRQAELAVGAVGGRLLLVETSGQDGFDESPAFYHRCGFERVARIRDFYADGDDKIVFRKSLAQASIIETYLGGGDGGYWLGVGGD